MIDKREQLSNNRTDNGADNISGGVATINPIYQSHLFPREPPTGYLYQVFDTADATYYCQ